jgi:hypothetical protein
MVTNMHERFKRRLEILEEHRRMRNAPVEVRHICFVDRDRREIDATRAIGPGDFCCYRNAGEGLAEFKQRASDECLQRKSSPCPILVFLDESEEAPPDAA